jgi:hypothetical protein
VHRAARICAAAGGGQVLVSQATQTLIEDEEEGEPGFTLVDVGELRLKDLDRPVRLFQLAAAGLEAPALPGGGRQAGGHLGGAAAAVHGLPATLTSFIGREEPVRQVAGLLEKYRLVTVTGPGGSGKTRLAGQVARRVAARFADGAWLVERAPVQDPGQVAVALFAERARQADAHFVLDGRTGPAVARLVARLDGMPLAIELAAARAEALGVSGLLGRLEDRFALLAGGDRLAPPRQRSLAAAVEWSYQLLEEAERRAFRAVRCSPGRSPWRPPRRSPGRAPGQPCCGWWTAHC